MKGESLKRSAIYVCQAPPPPALPPWGFGGRGGQSICVIGAVTLHKHTPTRSQIRMSPLALAPTLRDGVHANSQAVQLTYNSFLLELPLSGLGSGGSSQLHGAALSTPPPPTVSGLS